MPFTVSEVLAAALVLNRRTQEEANVSGDGLEIVRAVNRSLGGIYQIGARVNPGYHGKTEAVPEASGSWQRPVDAELIVFVADAQGTEVFRSTPHEPIPDPSRPCVVRWGHVYRRPAGAAIPAGSLTFWYSRRPQPASSVGSTVDLEDAFRALLEYDLGAWFAHRDERWTELGRLLEERDRQLSLYVASLEHESVGEVRNVGHTGTFDSPSVVDLKGLLLAHPPAG